MFYENRLGIKKSVISFVYLFCPNTGTKFREPYHSNHVIPHRGSRKTRLTENVGNRRNLPGFQETQISTERTAMHQFSSFSATFYADSLKFRDKAANYA